MKGLRRGNVGSMQDSATGTNRLAFPAIVPLADNGPSRRLSVATLLTDSSNKAWGYEWDCLALEPDSWLGQLQKKPVKMLFVESSWADAPGWASSQMTPNIRRKALADIVEWCKSNNIPTVFWSKQPEPYNVELFHAAEIFDVILTPVAERVEEYKDKLKHRRVGTLKFAAQPKLHNPIRLGNGVQTRDVGFAGRHSPSKCPELHNQIELVLRGANDASSKMEHGLEMFTGKPSGHAKHYPPVLNPRMVGRIEYEQVLSAYKVYKCFVASTSQEIFEAAASGTAVVASAGLSPTHSFDATEVLQAATRQESASLLRSLVQSTELRHRTVHLAQRKIWQQHTYSHRAAEVQHTVGIPAGPSLGTSLTEVPKISVAVSSIRPEQVSHILSTVGKQVNVDVELVLLAHGFEPDVSNIRAEALDHGIVNTVILQQPRTTSLGKCLNLAVDAASGTYVAKMDDDDLYGPHYLQDQSAALRFSGAAVSGKQAHYMYLTGPGVTLLRFGHNEHTFADFVMGPTMFTARETLKDMPFMDMNRGEDTDFLRRVKQAGGSIYSADRFNFLQMRSGDGDGHTWSVKEEDLMATGVVSFFGMNQDHIMF